MDILYNYSGSMAKQLRKNKKVHIAHPSLTIAMLNYSEEILAVPEIISKCVETIAFQHLRLISNRTFFLRTPQKNEVDMILNLKR